MLTLLSYSALIAQGLTMTIVSWLGASLISIALGITCGILNCSQIAQRRFNVISLYTFIAKGIPAYVQILIAYFAVPALLGVTIPGLLAATIALGICSAGYTTEILRSSINSVDKGQWEASFVCGYSRVKALKKIILPQAFRIAVPALLGECEQLLKSTSLLSAIGVMELTRAGMNIISRELNPLSVYALLALIYLLLSACLQIMFSFIEKRMLYAYRS
jgi:His/Glu/Gln/Arg/opine family amino acid ABC transporter permease subunit